MSSTEKRHVHVLPLSVYLGVGGALFILTGVTVGAAYIDLGPTLNLILAMAIATFKALLVALVFMHLLFDNKLYAVVFSIGLFMLTVFIVETMFDTLRRDGIYEYRAKPIKEEAEIYATLKEKALTEPSPTEASDGHSSH